MAAKGSATFYRRMGVSSPFDASYDLVTSPVLSPLALAICRLTLATYGLTVVLCVIIWEGVKNEDVGSFFSYFTHLSYIGLLSYMWAAGVQTLCYALNGKSYPLQRWPRPLQFLHRLLYSTVTTYPFVVTVVFWALLSNSSTLSTTFNAFDNISVHAMNSLFALLEILFTNVSPSPWLHLPICVLVFACYLGVAYITYATQGFYTYSFLNPGVEHAKLAGYIIAIGIAECLAFLLTRGLTWVRMRLSRRTSACRSGSPEHERQPSEEWEEIERPTSSAGHAV